MKRIPTLLAFAAAVHCGAATFKSSILFAGNPAGQETDTYNADGSIDIDYSFNDRGRGPEIHGHYKLDSRGFPESVVLTGHDYLKAPVDERLTVKDGEARWTSTTEHGAARSQGYYVSINGPTAEVAWLVNALLKTNDHVIALLPGGEAHLERGAQATLHNGDKSLTVTQYLITGFSFSPVTVWLDPENRFFAVASF